MSSKPDETPVEPSRNLSGERVVITSDPRKKKPETNEIRKGVTREMLLARFIRLCTAAMAGSTPRETAALIVNRISEIVPVDRAVLVNLNGKEIIHAVTGGGAAAQDSHFAEALDSARKRYRGRQDPVAIPRETDEKSPIRGIQRSMSGTSILWIPLWLDREKKSEPMHALWLERWQGRVWEQSDVELLQHAALFLGHSLLRPKAVKTRSGKRLSRIAAALICLVLFTLPVTSGVTAPVTVVPKDPENIFAPMDGILKELVVAPGQRVDQGALLFRYDARVLDKQLEEARRSVAVAQAKLVRLEGAAYRDPQARSEIPVQQLEVERARADVEFFQKQRERAEVRSEKPGIVVLDDPDSLKGAVLRTGQAVMSIAVPSETKLRILLPASDVGFLRKGAQVKIRLDSDPFRNLPGMITRIGFDVTVPENRVPSLLTEAIWSGKPPEVQPGQKGTARIYGKTTILGMQILRKPLIAIRNLTGF